MQDKILHHYREYSMFTNPGLYEPYFKSLSDDPHEIGELIRKNFIHRSSLASGNVGTNADKKYGDMNLVPWWRQAEDDNFPTVVAMIAELFRRDARGLIPDRRVEDKLVLTCRFDSLLMSAILKSKGIPSRVRSGFADYFEETKFSWDHWITQYCDTKDKRWITIDVDGSWHRTAFNFYDIPEGIFDFAADAWLDVRSGKRNGKHFRNAGEFDGLRAISLELFYDFHCLMNNEIIYLHHPTLFNYATFNKLQEEQLKEIDELALLMQKPDENFDQLTYLWETNREFRILKGALL